MTCLTVTITIQDTVYLYHVYTHAWRYQVDNNTRDTVYINIGISIVDADLTTDIVEPADFSRYVSNRTHNDCNVFIKFNVRVRVYS